MFTSEGGELGICQPLPEQGLWHTRHNKCESKESHQPQCRGCGESVQMALVEEGREMGGVECHLDTGRGSDQFRSGRLDKGV